MAGNKTNQHFVPAAYLKRFSGEDGLLWAHRTEERFASFQVGPHGVCKERNLYFPEVGECPKDESLENWLAAVEELGLNAMGKFVQLGDLSSESKKEIAFFIAIQVLRGPSERDRFHAIQDRKYHLVVDQLDLRPEHVREEAEKLGLRPDHVISGIKSIKKGELQLRPTKAYWLESFLENALQLAGQMVSLSHRLIQAPQGTEFLTSDNPVVQLPASSTSSAGLALALDPAHLLVFAPSDNNALTSPDSLELCERFNRMIVEKANRFVFSKSKIDLNSATFSGDL